MSMVSGFVARLPRRPARWLMLALLGVAGGCAILICTASVYLGRTQFQTLALTRLDDLHIWGPRTQFHREARRYETADAAAEAEAALRSGDARLMAGAGFGLVIPGVPREAYAMYEQPGQVHLLYSGCEVHSDEEDRFRLAAYSYAERYNKVILKATRK